MLELKQCGLQIKLECFVLETILACLLSGLDYFPGVHSRRWNGDSEDDQGRNEKILKIMENESNRNVYLISRFSLCNTDEELFKTFVKNTFHLSKEIRGNNGFGYDSILIPDPTYLITSIKGKTDKISDTRIEDIFLKSFDRNITIAELTQEEKNAINNRGRIAREIAEFLEGEMNG